MPDELEERLKSHARAFDSLLSLIPAKLYYGEDVSDQWKRKKQTPEQKKAAKMAKLDPDNWKSAKDVMDERNAATQKRKRDEDDESAEDAYTDNPSVDTEQPKAVQDKENPKTKKRKVDDKASSSNSKVEISAETEEDRKKRKAAQKAEKRQRKQEKKTKAKEKLERKKSKKQQESQLASSSKPVPQNPEIDMKLAEPIDLDHPAIDPNPNAEDNTSTASSSDQDELEVFSPPQESGVSSVSSIQALPEEPTKPVQQQPLHLLVPDEQRQESRTAPTSNSSSTANPKPQPDSDARERLQAALSAFRSSRKADDAPKSRSELLAQRRAKEEARKAAKKEQKRREREEAQRLQDEEIARRFSPGGSGSLLASPQSPLPEHGAGTSFTFGRVAFGDGSELVDAALGDAVTHKKKGPVDAAGALAAAQNKKARLAGMDDAKRAEIEQKDMWLNAKRKAHGEHVRDDTSLLKKALKRQAGQKRRSEREWNERIDGVKKAQGARQKKRADNLAKRRDEKKTGKGKGKVRRPGFEGSFKGRTGGKAKS